ncbi:hypothetical protein B0I35DRAFT_113795 [Stachybotrys elegans]|uniref:Rhodopsin domain-containing protein n=1 Tax=Stachybotrys elegans TaxID=80388 RepID=A0A8K0SJ05_9HYPO|nr:hypothetical protein B0I35DRAFT_113795 [Stachybotrys elegans]
MPLSASVVFDIVSATLCAALILTRCAYRLLFRCKTHTTCHRRWRIDDAYMALALIPLIGRTATITMNFTLNPTQASTPVTEAQAAEAGMTVEALTSNRIDAFKLIIAARICYALLLARSQQPARNRANDFSSLWCLKISLLTFYARFVDPLVWGHHVVRGAWCLLIASFITVLIVTLTECQPLSLAWQLAPAGERMSLIKHFLICNHRRNIPRESTNICLTGPSCARGVSNLLTMGTFNIVTDLMLIIMPLPILRLIRLDRKAKIQLTILFSIGLVVVIITTLRIPLILTAAVSQRSRSMWASIEILCACLVTNTSFFYALLKDVQGRHDTRQTNANAAQRNFYLESLPGSLRAEPDSEHSDHFEHDLPMPLESVATRKEFSNLR